MPEKLKIKFFQPQSASPISHFQNLTPKCNFAKLCNCVIQEQLICGNKALYKYLNVNNKLM